MEAGKLYICEEYFLLLYPDPETAAAEGFPLHGGAPGRRDLGAAVAAASYWSNRLGKPVLYAKKNIPLLILNNREKYVEVLVGDKKGWIIYQDWLELKEIV